MGMFSHSKTQVATQVQRVIEDNAMPNSIRDGWVTNQHDEDGDGDQLIENIMEKLSSSMGARAGRMYDWAKKDYIFGLPSATFKTSLAGRSASKAAIEKEVGAPVELTYYHFGPLNIIHLAWAQLVGSYGYDSSTNELTVLSAQKKFPVYLRDMQAIVKDATDVEMNGGVLDVWGAGANTGPVPETGMIWTTGRSPTQFVVDPAAAGDTVRVDISWEEIHPTVVEGITINKKTLKQDSFVLTIAPANAETEFHQARYLLGGKARYWSYQPHTGAHPEVDAVFDTEYTDEGSFFPFGYLRFNKHNDTDDKNSATYKSLDKLFGKVNMNFQSVSDSVNSNPDIADVEQAIMVMGVGVSTVKQIELRYLFDFFSGILPNSAAFPPIQAPPGIFNTADFTLFGKPLERTSIVIQDKRFKMTLSFEGIVRTRVAGTLGKMGDYFGGTDADTTLHKIPMIGGGTIEVGAGRDQHYYRHQITETVYEEVRVYGLKMTYFIWAEYTTTGDGLDPILLIPIDVNITKHYSLPDREQLYARGLHYVFNSRVTTHLKWYQTGLFRIVMVIIAIVCTILSEGSTWQSIGAALAAGTLTMEAFMIIVVQMVLKYIITMVLVKLFVKVVGAKFAFLVAVIAAIAGSYQAIEAGGLQGAPYAADLLTLSTNLTARIEKQVQTDFNDLLKDKTDFEEYVEKTTKTVETAEELLNPTGRMDPLLIFGEKPHDFYQRTVHSGNIGPIGVDAISAYVDTALRLPKLSDSIGEPA